MRVGIATDHGGFSLKEELLTRLRAAGHEIVDFGAFTLDADDDYPDFVVPLAEAVVGRQVERGVAICGSGVGASVCANKVAGIRAALVHDHFSAQQGVEDNHLNILCMGGRTVGPAVAWDLVQTFLGAEFSQAERHLRRLGKVARMEASPIGRVGGRERCSPRPRRSTSRFDPRRAARHELSAGRHDLSGWRQLQRVLEARHGRAVALLRSRGCRDAHAGRRSRPAAPALVPLLARLRARHHGRSALRLPRRWAVRSGQRPSFRPRQGAARSLRKMRGAACGLESRGGVRARRQLRLGAEERGRRPGCVRLGGRPSSCARPLPGRFSTRCTWAPSHGTPTPASRRRGAARMQA